MLCNLLFVFSVLVVSVYCQYFATLLARKTLLMTLITCRYRIHKNQVEECIVVFFFFVCVFVSGPTQ